MLSILLLIGLILSVLDAETVSAVIGAESGILGMAVAAVIGCITLIPGYVAIPLAASLLRDGAGYVRYPSHFYHHGAYGCVDIQRNDDEIYEKRRWAQRQFFCVPTGGIFIRPSLCGVPGRRHVS